LPGLSWASPSQFPDAYDGQIKAAAQRWWPGLPWTLWKAQLYQESRLDPLAVSPVGATGLAQFMPGTWAMVTKALRWELIDRRLAGPAIEGGAYYMATLRKQWKAKRPDEDRHKLAQASYNAGIGHLLTAQALCGGAALYDEIVACLPRVTGKHSKETIGYVIYIAKWNAMMELE